MGVWVTIGDMGVGDDDGYVRHYDAQNAGLDSSAGLSSRGANGPEWHCFCRNSGLWHWAAARGARVQFGRVEYALIPLTEHDVAEFEAMRERVLNRDDSDWADWLCTWARWAVTHLERPYFGVM